MPTIDLTDAEHAAVTAAIRRAIEDDGIPRAPRLDSLRSALAKLDPHLQDIPCPREIDRELIDKHDEPDCGPKRRIGKKKQKIGPA
jgi:hypothetical protein